MVCDPLIVNIIIPLRGFWMKNKGERGGGVHAFHYRGCSTHRCPASAPETIELMPQASFNMAHAIMDLAFVEQSKRIWQYHLAGSDRTIFAARASAATIPSDKSRPLTSKTDSIKTGAARIGNGMMGWYTGNNTGDTPGNLPDPYYCT